MVNIFFLDEDFDKAASFHFDIHICKGILEINWILNTVRKIRNIEPHKGAMNRFIKHGCVTWAAHSYQNYETLYLFMQSLNNEYKYRFNKLVNHKSFEEFNDLFIYEQENKINYIKNQFSNDDKTYPYLAMFSPFRLDNPAMYVESYRIYYFYHKRFVLPYTSWSKRTIPFWYKKEYFINNNFLPKDINI